MEKSLKVLTIGGAVQDIYLGHQGADCMRLMENGGERNYMLFESGSKVEVQNILYYTGGGSTNSAVSLKRLGFDVSCFCMVGHDAAGKAVLDDLKQEQVDTSTIVTSKEHATGTSFVINSLRRDRTIFAYRGANGFLSQGSIPYKEIESSGQLYITSLSHESSQLLHVIGKHAQKHKIPVAVNPGISQLSTGVQELKESLKYIDILILNSSEAKVFMGALVEGDDHYQKVFESSASPEECAAADGAAKEPLETATRSQEAYLLKTPLHHKNVYFSVPNFFKEVMKMGPKIVVVTDGSRGVYVATQKHVLFHPSLSVDVVDTLGAGDAFGSCFVGCCARGMSCEDALRRGIVNSASVIGYMGAKPGLLSHDEVEKRACSLRPYLLQKYEL